MFFGIITVVFSFVMFFFMPDSPVEAKFLTDHQKVIAIERLRMNQQGVMSREWRWDHLWESLRDVKTWLWFALVFSISYVFSLPFPPVSYLTLLQHPFRRHLNFRSPDRQVLRV